MASGKELESLAREIAGRNLDVGLQAAIAEQELQLYYQHLVESRDFISNRLKECTGRETLDGWIVCGSGLASLPQANGVQVIDRIPTDEIPHWFSPKAPGHGKDVVIANINGQTVGIQTGRAHIYDTDYSPRQLRLITAPLIVAKGLGVNWVITTNASGAMENSRVQVGDVVVDVDYVNQHGVNPLIGPNDERLGMRFPGKPCPADPFIFERLEKFIPEDRLHLGIYTLPSNTPFFEGGADILRSKYHELTSQNPKLVETVGMSFATEAMILQHFNNPSIDINGFDRQVRWIGLISVANIIPEVVAPTKEMLREVAIPCPNPTTEEEVLEGGVNAEKLLVPAVIQLCGSITQDPLPPIE